jgi:steroid delta-isomerase-like uncharacterized protein
MTTFVTTSAKAVTRPAVPVRVMAKFGASEQPSRTHPRKDTIMYEDHVNALLAAWNEGDLEGLDAYLAPDTIRRAPASANSDANSLRELKEVITSFRTRFPDAKVTVHELTFHGNRAFAEWTFTGTNTGPGDFPPTGRPVRFDGSSFHQYADGKLVEERVYFDGMDMMTQLGMIPGSSGG